jgi:hypothetical protein
MGKLGHARAAGKHRSAKRRNHRPSHGW